MSNKAKLIASAQKNLQKGQLAKAIKDYQKVVEIDPRDIRNRQKLAELLNRNRQVDEALEEYEAVAKYYSENGFYLKAIAVYKQMQRIDPSQVRIYHRLAELNEKQGLTGNALAEYRSLVSYYEQHDMVSEVVNVLQKMKDIDPENLNVLVKIAEAYARSGMSDKAREEFIDVVERLRDKGEYAKILKLCDLLLPFFPDDPVALQVKAEALVHTGACADAIPILVDVVGRKPELSSLELLARARHDNGDYPGEIEARRLILDLVPDDLECRLNYVGALLDAEQDQEALKELEEWKDSCVQAGMTSRVKSYYELLSTRFDDNQAVVNTLRAIYEMTGEGDKLFDLMSDNEEAESLETPFGDDPEFLGDGLVEEALSDLEEIEPAEFGSEPEQVNADTDASEIEAEIAAGEDLPESKTDEEVPFESEEPDEVPLEFLEEIVEEQPETGAEPQPAEMTGQAAGGLDDLDVESDELELELEFDLDFDPGDEGEVSSDLGLSAEEGSVEETTPETADAVEIAAPSTQAENAEAESVEVAGVQSEDLEAASEDTLAPEILDDMEVEVELVEEGTADVKALLDEAVFYLQQNLYDEADRLCRQVLEDDPGNSRAALLLEEIETNRRDVAAGHETRLDWDGALKDILGDSIGTIDAEDAESHYNLGIAYKEMGLLDDAVKEFETAMAHPSRRISCLTLKALCQAEMGDAEGAEKSLQLGLACPDLSSEEKLNLLFEMGQLKEASGAGQEALNWFLKVAETDHFYRDVGLRIRQLRSRLGLPDEGLDSAPGSRGQDKVTYL